MKKLLLAAMVIFTGCAGVSSDTRIFATGETGSAGFDSGVTFSAEQRLRKGPVMALTGVSYSPTTKSGAESGYQYGADAGIRFYYNNLFAGAGYYWSGYHMEFKDGREWDKDGHNVMFSAGWERGPWEIRFAGSPREDQSPNKVSWISGAAEYKVYGPLILEVGLQRTAFDQGGKRESDWTQSLGIGLEF